MTTTTNDYGEELRRCRQAAGISRERLADELARSFATIRNWETGATVPPGEVRVRIAAILDAPQLVDVER